MKSVSDASCKRTNPEVAWTLALDDTPDAAEFSAADANTRNGHSSPTSGCLS